MSSIGNLVYRLRKRKKMSRAALSEGICSEKMIYYIENDKRTPSTKMLNRISERLGTDLYEYLPYIDCKEPEKVKQLIEAFEDAGASDRFEELAQITEEAKALGVLTSSEEAMAEINYYETFCAIFARKGTEDIFERIRCEVEKAGIRLPIDKKSKDCSSIFVLRYINLLGIYYMQNGEGGYGCAVFEWLNQQIEGLKKLKKHQRFYISVKLNYMRALRTVEVFEPVLELSEDLKKYQRSTRQLDRMYMSCWNKAHALFGSGKIEESAKEFIAMLFLGAAELGTDDFREFLNSKKGHGFGTLFYAEPTWVEAVNKRLSNCNV